VRVGPFELEHILAVANKEFREIYRDPRYIAFALVLPIVLLFLYGYAITMDVQNLLTAYVNFDKTTLSARYMDRFASSRYFQVAKEARSRKELEELMERSEIRLGIVIPADFSRKLYGGKRAEVEFLVDGTWPNMANLAIGYVQAVNGAFNQGMLQGLLQRAGLMAPKSPEPIVVEPRVWFNEDLDSLNFIIPGLYAAIFMSFPPILCALAIVREKEAGSIEQIYMSPISSESFILGKLIPQLTIAFTGLVLLALLGTFWFGVQFKGDPLLFFGLGVLYLSTTCGFGLLVSSVTRTQVAAMIGTMILTMIPAFLFSGFFFPISNLAKQFILYSYLFSGRFFVVISRGIVIKGVHLETLYPQVFGLLIYAAAIYAISFFVLRKRL